MQLEAANLINSIDLINLSKDIAQINLGYLGISVTILGVIGGFFVYFNIKPLQEKLNKQEEAIKDVKEKAVNLLKESESQTQSSLKIFEEKQLLLLETALEQQENTVYLEVANKIKSAEVLLLEKIDSISDDKDEKLKEILLSEMTNKILSLEKSLTAVVDEKLSKLKSEFDLSLVKIKSDLLELKAYKYDMEGKMGGIIFSIEAVEKSFKDEPHLLKYKLQALKEKIGKYILDPELFIRLKTILKKIEEKNDEHHEIIKEIKELTQVETKPEF